MCSNSTRTLSTAHLIAGFNPTKNQTADAPAAKAVAGLVLCGLAAWMLTSSAAAAGGAHDQLTSTRGGTINLAADDGSGETDSGLNVLGGGPGSASELLNLPALPIVQPMPYKILVAEQPSNTVKSKYPSHKAGDILVLYTQDIDPSNTGMFTVPGQVQIQGMLNEFMPDLQSKGLVVLDWEGLAYHNLVTNIGSPLQQATMAEYIKAAQFVRSLRPQARVSVYGVPEVRYWNRNAEWQANAVALKPLIQQLDYLCPSIYDYYATADDSDYHVSDKEYAKDNVRLTLTVAEGRPVYPFIWPRFHDSNNKWKMRLIPSSEFKAMIKCMTNIEVNGKRISGVAWWGNDKHMRYVFHHPPPPSDAQAYAAYKVIKKVFQKEIPPDMTENKFFNETHLRILKDLKSSLETLPNPPAP